MNSLMKSEWFKLPKKTIIGSMLLAVCISEALAAGLYLYNLHFSNIEPSSLRYIIYGLAWFTPVFFVLYSIFSTILVSVEYEHKMWSVLLVSKQSKRNIAIVKFIIIIILMFITSIIFILTHLLFNLIINGELLNISVFLYIMIAFFIGTLAMQAIQFFIVLVIENKVYVTALGMLIAIVNLLIQSNYMPFKIPEHIIKAQQILSLNKVTFFDTNFFVYGLYSLLIFIVILAISAFYIKRKEF